MVSGVMNVSSPENLECHGYILHFGKVTVNNYWSNMKQNNPSQLFGLFQLGKNVNTTSKWKPGCVTSEITIFPPCELNLIDKWTPGGNLDEIERDAKQRCGLNMSPSSNIMEHKILSLFGGELRFAQRNRSQYMYRPSETEKTQNFSCWTKPHVGPRSFCLGSSVFKNS